MSISPRLPDGTWRFTASLGADPVTGKRIQKVHRFRGAARDVERAHAEWLLKVKPTSVGETQSHAPLSVLFDRVLPHWEQSLTPYTLSTYRGVIENHLRPALGDIRLVDLRASHLDEFYRVSVQRFEASTVKSWHTVLSSALQQALRWEWLDRNPADLAQRPSARNKRVATPDTEIVVQFMDWLQANDTDLLVAVELLASTGCRVAEVCALQWRHVDWSGTLLIEGSVERGRERRVKETKTGGVRLVSLDQGVLDVLAPHKDAEDRFVVRSKSTNEIPESPVRLNHRIAAARKAAGTPTITGRALRHYVATRLIVAGVDPRTVAGRLGHSSANTTLKVYAAFVPERDREAAELLRKLRER